MKCCYIYSRIEKDVETSGEAKKAKMQAAALTQNGVPTDVIYHDRYINHNKILIRLPFYSIYNRVFSDELIKKIKDIDVIYIRKYVIDNSFIKLLKRIKTQYPEKIILFEIPTYPYDKEWSSFVDFPLLLKERINRKKLYKYVDRIITFSKDSKIFNIDTINTSNGIDVDVIPLRINKSNESPNINLIGVATLEKWHGYDRLIKGIHDYYKTDRDKKIIFHIVGSGAELENLKKLTKSCNVEDYVIFYGPKKGSELDYFFSIGNIGVGSLGMNRIGLSDGYTLKLREYMARGLPFIYAYNDSLIESCGEYFYHKFPNDESTISIDEIIDFYYKIKSISGIEDKMRKISEEKLTWVNQMKPIAKYIEEEKKNND